MTHLYPKTNNMDVLLFFSGLLLISLLTSCLLHTLLSHKTKKKSTHRLPPGNVGIPVVGESLEFWSFLRAGISERFIFRRMAKYSRDVFKTSLIMEPVAVLCGSAGSRFLFTNDNKLVRQWWPLGLNALLAPSRRSPFPLKNIILLFFKVDDLKKQVGIMDRLAKGHLETKWQRLQEVTVLPLARNFAFTIACSLTFTMEDGEAIEKLQGLVTTILGGFLKLKINLPGTPYNRALKAWNATRKLISEIVRRRRELLETAADSNGGSGFQDTLSSLLEAIQESGEEMSDVDIADRLIGVLVVIHDTTSVVITMIFKYLAKHPHVYDAVLQENMEVAARKTGAGEVELNWEDMQEMKYTWNVTREVLRLCPPAQALLREALVDFSYAGFRIPKGWKLLLSIKTIHMDPQYFPEPEKFDPSRFEGSPLPNTYMPFGGGLNLCPGKSFAQVLILVFIHNAVTRFKWEVNPHDSDDQVLVDPIPRPTSGVRIRLCPAAPNQSIN